MQRVSNRRRPQCRVRWWIVLALLTAGLGAFPFVASAQTDGIACNPDVRENNVFCTEGAKCLRVRGDCGALNWLCVDGPTADPSFRRAAALAPDWICGGACRSDVGRCESGIVFCNSDRDCQARELCRGGVCIFQVGSCVRDDDCQRGQTCQRQAGFLVGSCVGQVTPPPPQPPRPPECRGGNDCGPGKLCRDGKCVPKGSIQPCRSSKECGPDEGCYQGRCLKE